jgi:acyl carrier protein
MTSYETDLRQFIVENFLFGKDDQPVASSDSLLELGIVDSTAVLELVGFLEQTYQITIDDEELVPDNLDSIDRIVQFVTRKLEKAA